MIRVDAQQLKVYYIDPVKDAERIVSFYKSLSRQSIRLRFLHMVSNVEEHVKSLLSLRLIIYGVFINNELVAIGEAYGKGTIYEVALVVKDEYQGRGIGKFLMGFMLRDLFMNRGATRVYAFMSIDNIRMINTSRRYGGKVIIDDDTYRVIFDPVNLRLNH